MLMLDGSNLAGAVAPLPLWPRKPTPLNQLQPLETRMSFFSDDDVVVYSDPQGLCDFHNDPRHFNIGARRRRVTSGMIVQTPLRDLIALKTNKQLNVRRWCGDGDWERLCVLLRDRHASSCMSIVSRFDARHVTIFF